jgi:multiple antibiotic resistance protein
MTHYTQGILTVLSLVNPAICAAMLMQSSGAKPRAGRIADATKAILAIAVILCLAALGGSQLLHVFGISLSAFQTAGGMVLVWMGFTMLRGNASPTTSSDQPPSGGSLTPLILFAASPGTITGVITLSVADGKSGIPVSVLIAIVAALGITWLILLAACSGTRHGKPGLLHDVTTRLMGLTVLAMGVQFLLAGTKAFFATAAVG